MSMDASGCVYAAIGVLSTLSQAPESWNLGPPTHSQFLHQAFDSPFQKVLGINQSTDHPTLVKWVVSGFKTALEALRGPARVNLYSKTTVDLCLTTYLSIDGY